MKRKGTEKTLRLVLIVGAMGFTLSLIGIFTMIATVMGLGITSMVSEGYNLYMAFKFSLILATVIGIVCGVFSSLWIILEKIRERMIG